MTDKVENKSSLSEAEKFLESLNLPDSQAQGADGAEAGDATDPNDIMSFLDEISNYPTEDAPKEEEKKKQVDNEPQHKQKKVNAVNDANTNVPIEQQQQQQQEKAPEQSNSDNGWKSWGNSFWNQASAAVKTTTDQINRSVGTDSAKLLESRVKTLQNLVNKENIEKLGTFEFLKSTMQFNFN
jgi:hypothetical protein